MIVIEGPDGAGKTTLAKEIQAQFPNVTIAPRVVDTEANALVDVKAWVEDDAHRLNQGVLFDRHRLISEPIYGSVLRSPLTEPGFGDLGWLMAMNSLFYRKKPTLIYAIPPKRVCIHENEDCWPSMATPTQRAAIYHLYLAKAAVDIGMNRAVHYDYTEGPKHLKSIMGYINREEWF